MLVRNLYEHKHNGIEKKQIIKIKTNTNPWCSGRWAASIFSFFVTSIVALNRFKDCVAAAVVSLLAARPLQDRQVDISECGSFSVDNRYKDYANNLMRPNIKKVPIGLPDRTASQRHPQDRCPFYLEHNLMAYSLALCLFRLRFLVILLPVPNTPSLLVPLKQKKGCPDWLRVFERIYLYILCAFYKLLIAFNIVTYTLRLYAFFPTII